MKLLSKQASKLLLGVALTVALINSANATPVDWTMSDATLSYTIAKTRSKPSIDVVDNISFSFTYDADTNLITNVNLVSSYYGNGNSVSNSSLKQVQDVGSAHFMISASTSPSNVTLYTLDFGKDRFVLTNAGGTVTGAFGYPGSFFAPVTFTGVPQATATAVPEPEAYAMMLAGLGLVGFAARRKQQAV